LSASNYNSKNGRLVQHVCAVDAHRRALELGEQRGERLDRVDGPGDGRRRRDRLGDHPHRLGSPAPPQQEDGGHEERREKEQRGQHHGHSRISA